MPVRRSSMLLVSAVVSALVLILLVPVVASASTLDVTAGALTYTASPAVNNALTVSVTAGVYTFNDTAETITLTANATGAGFTGSGTNTVTGPDANVSSIALNVGDGTNSVHFVSYDDPTTVNGSTGSDTISVDGVIGTQQNFRYAPSAAGAGTIIEDSGTEPNIVFTSIEHLAFNLQSADNDGFRIDGTTGNDAFTFSHGGTAGSGVFSGTMNQNGTSFALADTTFTGTNPATNDVDVNFFNPGGTDTLTFNGTSSDDGIAMLTGEAGGREINNTISSTMWSRLEVFNLSGGYTVNGGAGNDTFTRTGISGTQENFRYVPTSFGNGSLLDDTSAANPPTTFTGVEHLAVILQPADNDGVRLDGTTGNDQIVFSHGGTAGSGVFTGTMNSSGSSFALDDFSFSGTNPATNDADVNFFNPGGIDTLTFNGTSGDDKIDVGIGEAGGVGVKDTVGATLWSNLEIYNIGLVNVMGGNGNDTFHVIPQQTTLINVVGGSPTPPAVPGDVLTVDRTGTTGQTYTQSFGPSGFSGTYGFSNRQAVTFSEIELDTIAIPALSPLTLLALAAALALAGMFAVRRTA